VRFAYADPPYPGQAKRHYGEESREVNHQLLIAHLGEFDAWALSTSSSSLREVLSLCPSDVRIASWVKGWCSWKPGVHPKYAWEPIIYTTPRSQQTVDSVRDWVMCNVTTGRPVHGAKPDPFWRWLFPLLGATPADEFVDVFPGSGAGSRNWDAYRSQLNLFTESA